MTAAAPSLLLETSRRNGCPLWRRLPCLILPRPSNTCIAIRPCPVCPFMSSAAHGRKRTWVVSHLECIICDRKVRFKTILLQCSHFLQVHGEHVHELIEP